MTPLHVSRSVFFLLPVVLVCAGCSILNNDPIPASGGRSGAFVATELAMKEVSIKPARRSSLLGLYTSTFLAEQSTQKFIQGGILGATAQERIADRTASVGDPDFDLLQAFTDALTTDLRDMLNRSADRATSLSIYLDALRNVTDRAKKRSEELISVTKELSGLNRTLKSEASTARRAAENAIKERDFAAAADAQKTLLEKESSAADIAIRLSQAEEVLRALEEMIVIADERIAAIEKNREAIIVGVQVVDMPGIDSLQLIERTQIQKKRGGGIGGLL